MEGAWKKKSLVVMAKVPVKGEVKTRLIPWLGEEGAYELYICLLQDRLEEVSKLLGVDLYIACFPFEKKDLIEELFSKSWQKRVKFIPQEGNDLGERIISVFSQFNLEKEKVVLVDTDTPSLTSQIINSSFKFLKDFDLIIGPANDGGYYLVGLKEKHFDLFEDIPWSTRQVSSLTIEKAEKKNLKVKLLSALIDIDRKEDALLFYSSREKKGALKTVSFLKKILTQSSKKLI